MKKQTKYSSQEEQESHSAKEPEAIYFSQKKNGITDVGTKPDWAAFPGQFTDEEKLERMKKAIEDTCGYSQNEMKKMLASWRK